MKLSLFFGFILFLIVLSPVNAFAQFFSTDYDTLKSSQEGFAEGTVIGSGELQKSISSGQDIAASTGLGLMYWRIWPDDEGGVELQLDLVINVASTVDTLIATTENNLITNNISFGNYILTPAIAGKSTEINAVFYFEDENLRTPGKTKIGKWLTYIDGVQFNAFGASELWRYDSTYVISDQETLSKARFTDVSVFGWRTGIFYDFISEEIRRTKGFSVRLSASYIGRAIQGDGGHKSSEATHMRKKFLLSEKTTYHGIEFGLTARFGNITAKAVVPIMPYSDTSVPGLSGTQFITTIGFVGGLPKFELKH